MKTMNKFWINLIPRIHFITKQHPEFEDICVPLSRPVFRYLGVFSTIVFCLLLFSEHDPDRAGTYFLYAMGIAVLVILFWRGVNWRNLLWPNRFKRRHTIDSIFVVILILSVILIIFSSIIFIISNQWSAFNEIIIESHINRLDQINEKLSDIIEIISLRFLKFVFVFVFLTPIIEEVIFRYIIFVRIGRYTGLNISIFVSSFLFAAGHGFTPNSLAIGFVSCIIFMRTGSLFSSIAYHAFNNFVTIVIVLAVNILHYGEFRMNYNNLLIPDIYLIQSAFPSIATLCSTFIISAIVFCWKTGYRPFRNVVE